MATANYMILEQLLAEGHSIDFHAIGGFIRPDGLIGRDRFTFVPTTVGAIRAGWKVLEGVVPRRLRAAPTMAYSTLSNAVHEQAIAREIGRRHTARPYDVLLVMGTLAPFRVPGLRCVSWPQGPPQTEWEALRSRRADIVKYCGRGLYLGLGALYRQKQRASRRLLKHSDLIVCLSRWSAEGWERFGVARESIRAIPYPYDLNLFRPVPRVEEPGGPFRFLWLGRIVPRKRLDLVLAAFQRLRAHNPALNAELLVIGRFDYARGFRRLLEEYQELPGLIYRPSATREEVATLFSRVDCVIQPSENENLGSAVLEGLCCGVPAIVGPTNGTQDYLDGSSIVFDAYTPESVESAMQRMIERVQSDRPRLAQTARAAAERHLRLDHVTRQLVEAMKPVGA